MSEQRTSTWRLAGRLFRYRPGMFVLGFATLVAWNGSTLLIGWLLQQVFDALSGGAPAGFGVYAIIAVLAAAEVTQGAAIWAGVVRDRCWQHIRGLLRLNLLRAQMHSGGPPAGAPATSPGDAVSRFRDDVDDFVGFLETALITAGKIVVAVGSMAIMLTVEPGIAVAVALPLIAVVIVTRLASGRIRAHRAAYRRATAAVTGLLGEMFGAVLAVKSAHASDGILEQLARRNEQRRRAGLRDQLITKLLGTVNRTTVDLSIGVVLLLAVPAMHRGDFTVGDLALFVSYIGSLVWVPHYTGQLLTRHRQAGVSIDRMAALLPSAAPDALAVHQPLQGPNLPAPTPVHDRLERLTVCGLTAVHPTSGRGVRDLSLTLERGTFTVVTGPAGAGKTTLLRAILGHLPAQVGTVYWNDVAIADRAEFLVPPRSAYVPQVPRLFSESLRDNLLLGNADTSGLLAAVRTGVLDRDVESMPAGLDTQVGARGVRLSGGQVQRAAIARALLRRANLLVLDDVSSALDVETERRLWDQLLADRDHTVLVVSHRPATIARADQVIRLDQGRIQPASVESSIANCADAA